MATPGCVVACGAVGWWQHVQHCLYAIQCSASNRISEPSFLGVVSAFKAGDLCTNMEDEVAVGMGAIAEVYPLIKLCVSFTTCVAT